MSEPIEGEYFNWLCAKVLDNPRNPNYHDLLRILYSTEFEWELYGDKNRSDDGKELRVFFLRELGIDNEPFWYNGPCSVLEMLIALATKAQWETDISAKTWFWRFLENLELNEYRRMDVEDVAQVELRLRMFIDRAYHPNGVGGIFPMRNETRDQRQLEIWFQFCEYLVDQGL